MNDQMIFGQLKISISTDFVRMSKLAGWETLVILTWMLFGLASHP